MSVFDLTKIEKALLKYDDQGKKYLIGVHVPGITWSETERARSWSRLHVANFDEMVRRKDECLFCSYSINIKGYEIYRGSSIKPFSRGLVHLANLYNNPSLFGLTFSDLENPRFVIAFKVEGTKLFEEEARKAREYAEISFTKPLIMKANGTDELLDIRQRRAVMKKTLIMEDVEHE